MKGPPHYPSLVGSLIETIGRSLALQLGLVLALFALGIFLFQTALVGSLARSQLEADNGERLVQRSTAISALLDQGMFERYHDIQILASLPVVHDPQISTFQRRQLLERFQETHPGYAWIGLTDERGSVLVSTGALLEGQDVSTRPWFRGAQRAPFVGDVQETQSLADLLPAFDGEPARFVAVAAPVVDAHGAFIGVLGAHLSWHWAQETQEALALPALRRGGEDVLILNADGRVILGPDSLLHQPLRLNSVVAARAAQTGFITEIWPDGRSYLVGYQQSQGYQNYPGLGWIVLVRQPAELAYQPAQQLQHELGTWLLLSLSVLVIGVATLIRRLTRPLRASARVADRLRLGDTTVMLPVLRGHSEIARLTRSLSQLVDELLQYKATLYAANQRLRIELDARADAQHALQRMADRAACVARAGTAFADQLDLNILLPTICGTAASMLDADIVCVHLYHARSATLELGAEVGLQEAERRVLYCAPASHESATMLTLLESLLPQPAGTGRTWTLVPLRRGDQILGVLSARVPADDLTDEQDFLRRIGDSAAQAIANTLSYEQARRRLRTVQALHMIDRAITASYDQDEMLRAILAPTLEQLGTHAAIIWFYNETEQEWRWGFGSGLRFPLHTALVPPSTRTVVDQAVREQSRIVISNIRTLADAPGFEHWCGEEDIASYFAVPLVAHGVVNGLLEVLHRTSLQPDDEWFDLLDTLAGQIAIGLYHLSLFEGLHAANEKLSQAYDTTIEGWSRALDLRDKETEGHSRRVTALTLDLARALGMSEEELIHVRRGALLHDIGKMGIPDAILLKPGPLDAHEWAIMKRHPAYAYELLNPIAYLHPSLDIPYYHHEKWNGAGYPFGLSGEQIPLAARIFAVVDVFDALTHDRPYHRARAPQVALSIIAEQSGVHFDPQVVQLFLALMEERDLYVEALAQNVGEHRA